MSNLFQVTDVQSARLEPYLPKSYGRPGVDDRRVLSGIIFVTRNGLRWRDADAEHDPAKTLYNRWTRWSGMGVFTRMMAGLAAEADLSKTIMIGATFPEGAPHGFSPRAKKGARAAHRAHEGWAEHKAPRRCG